MTDQQPTPPSSYPPVTTPFAVGSDLLSGAGKFVEEAGEALQVFGKLMGTGGDPAHWDGSDLNEWLTNELSDVQAAAAFFAQVNSDRIDADVLAERTAQKLALFHRWHVEQRQRPTATSGALYAGVCTPLPVLDPPTVEQIAAALRREAAGRGFRHRRALLAAANRVDWSGAPITWRWVLHNVFAHPLLVLYPPLGEWLHDHTEPR